MITAPLYRERERKRDESIFGLGTATPGGHKRQSKMVKLANRFGVTDSDFPEGDDAPASVALFLSQINSCKGFASSTFILFIFQDKI